MELTLSFPDRYRLAGLEQGSRGWTCYLQMKKGFYLQGRVAATPQQAIDDCVAAMDKYIPTAERPILSIDLSDINI